MSLRFAILLGITMLIPIGDGAAQQPSPSGPGVVDSLDSYVARAVQANPSIRAAEQRWEAARARVGPAGSLPDPMLMAGLMNQPLGGSDEMSGMAMKTVGVGQMIPFPGSGPWFAAG